MQLTEVLDALRDPIRREVVRRLAERERLCSDFADLGSASGMSYHFTRLRTAGLTNTRKAGTCRLISLRFAEVEAALPGLLPSVLAAENKATAMAVRPSAGDDRIDTGIGMKISKMPEPRGRRSLSK